MIALPAPGALGDSARTAFLAAMLAVAAGVAIAWIASARRRRRRHHARAPVVPPSPAPQPAAPLPEPLGPLAPPARPGHSRLTPYVNGASAPAKSHARAGPVDPDAVHLNSASYEELRTVEGIDP